MALRRREFASLLASGAAALALPACAGAPERSLRPLAKPAQSAATIAARAGLGGQTAYAVMDMASGAILDARAPEVPLPPASVAKTITALYALDRLGAAHRFRTQLVATGPVRDGVLQGDLVLAGGGDPTLDTNALAAMIARLRRGGLTRVAGRLRVWGGALPAVPQIADDQVVQAGYNPAVGGLNLNFNRVHFAWSRNGGGYAVRMDARAGRHRPEVQLARMQVANRARPLYTFDLSDGVEQWSVARRALGSGGARWLPVRQPDLYAGEVVQALARDQGLALPAPQRAAARPRGQVLAEHRSDRLDALLQGMLRYSTNLTAEAVGLTATTVARGAPANLAASGSAMNAWARARFGMTSLDMVDHSGLGAASRVSMADLVRMYRGAGQDGALRPLLRDHPFRDGAGRRLPDQPFPVQAKTGTLYFVSALGGYMQAQGGRPLAFAICSADLPRRRQVLGADTDRPAGTARWARRARAMQQDMLHRWARAHQAG